MAPECYLKKKTEIKLKRVVGVPSPSGQIGQHSPSGMIGSSQSDESSQITSSHRGAPLSHTQIRHGSGFHTSLSLYSCPSVRQLPNGPDDLGRERDCFWRCNYVKGNRHWGPMRRYAAACWLNRAPSTHTVAMHGNCCVPKTQHTRLVFILHLYACRSEVP